MKLTQPFSRRSFLKGGAALGALAAFGRPGRAFATTATDYKALVCVYLAGGCDGNNVLIPLDLDRYGAYKAARGAVAIPQNKLAATAFTDGTLPYAFHYGLPKTRARYLNGDVAVAFNVGNLLTPMTRDDVVQNLKATPTSLFSHSDQTVQIQMGGVPRGDGTGWGGRLLDCVTAGKTSLGAISTTSPAAFLRSLNDTGNVVPPGSSLSLAGMNVWPSGAATARRQAFLDLLPFSDGNPLRAAVNKAFSDGLQLGDDLAAAGAADPILTQFPPTWIGKQMQQIANLIQMRSGQGPGRQIFIATFGSFDTHGGQDYAQWDLLVQLDDALDAFHKAMDNDLHLGSQVTSFTLSEFGRTLQSNGTGSDHGWGNHQLVLGGAVEGGLYGQLPDFTLKGPDDANNRGVWIPTQSTEQFAATLGRWFGASEDEIAWAFPSLELFDVNDLGFMG
jgi:uncharacterized protein (DUF1501 family)